MTTHWRTTHRNEPRLRPDIACDESIVVPVNYQPAAVQGEPMPVPGRFYGTPANTRHIDLQPDPAN